MRLLPSGSTAVLVELAHLDEVLALYAALLAERPPGVVEIVPAARTVLLVTDPRLTTLGEVARAVQAVRPVPAQRAAAEPVEVPVTYDGVDLLDVASLLGCDAREVVWRHTAVEWTVAFSGFAPGFGYLVPAGGPWDVPRRSSPRTTVPAGSIGLAGPFSAVYPRESPGGWQLIGHTELQVFDLDRDPPALLSPGTPVRFVEVAAHVG